MQWSIMPFSKALQNVTGFRFDAEYFKPEFVHKENILQAQTLPLLGNFAFVTDGQHGYHEVDDTSPISHLTAKNAKNWFADNINADRIAKWVDDNNRRSSLQENDIILSTRGSVGMCALVDKTVLPANIDQDVARIWIHQEALLPEYLVAYLNSVYGQSWLLRNASGMVQQGLSLDKVRLIPVPKQTEVFQHSISKIVLLAREKLYHASTISEQAINKVLTELGLENWQPKKQLSFVANYAEVEDVNRFDADYFQPHYKELLKRISEQQVKLHIFEEAVQLRDKNYQPLPEKEYRYIELSNIGGNGEITGFSKELGQDLPSRARRIVRKGDVIISSIEGSIDSVALISDKEDGALCSTGFYVAHSEIYNPETLLVLLKSIVGQLQLKKGCNGTILTAVSKDEMNKLKLPEINQPTQEQLKQLVQQMYDDRAKSKHLLETAKRAVEIAIEEDEAAAFHFIEMEAK